MRDRHSWRVQSVMWWGSPNGLLSTRVSPRAQRRPLAEGPRVVPVPTTQSRRQIPRLTMRPALMSTRMPPHPGMPAMSERESTLERERECESEHVVPTDPAVIATGLPVDADPTGTPCARCGRQLRSGTPVTALLARKSTPATWQIEAVACRGCSLTPSATQPAVAVTGTLTTCPEPHTQTHQLCLTAVSCQSNCPQPLPSASRKQDR